MPHVRVLIGQRLRQARNKAGLDQASMAAFLEQSQAQISRIESGKRPISVKDVRRWLTHTSVPDTEYTEIVELAQSAGTDVVTFDELKAGGWHAHQKRYGDLEKEALVTKKYQNSLVPGLLQTPAYVDYLMREVVCKPDEKIQEAIKSRLERHELLFRPSTHLQVVITESVLRQPFGGPALMAEQLDQIASLAHLPAVDLAVLPTDTPMADVLGTHFVLHEMPSPDESVVLIELLAEEVTETAPEHVALYREKFDVYQAHSLRGDDAIQFVQGVAGDLRRKADL